MIFNMVFRSANCCILINLLSKDKITDIEYFTNVYRSILVVILPNCR